MDVGVVITETLGGRLLTLAIGPAAAAGWTPTEHRGWLGRDDEGSLVALTTYGDTPAQARAALLSLLIAHRPDTTCALERLLR